MNIVIQQLLIQIKKQQDDEIGDYYYSLNQLYYDLYLEVERLA